MPTAIPREPTEPPGNSIEDLVSNQQHLKAAHYNLMAVYVRVIQIAREFQRPPRTDRLPMREGRWAECQKTTTNGAKTNSVRSARCASTKTLGKICA